jgi:FMN reductase (NADPH)
MYNERDTAIFHGGDWMNDTIETILGHKSIRNFEDRALTDEQIKTLVRCAQAASTSSFVQAYTIIGVRKRETKEKLAELAGNQAYVAENGHLFVFCADLHRNQKIANRNLGLADHADFESLQGTEMFMVALIDAALAAQNMTVAAESMGLGICYIGGIRNRLPEVTALLKTPKLVLPLFGLVVGYPAQDPEPKPRLPFELIYHEEEYSNDEERFLAELEQYDQIISDYYNRRTGGKRADKWSEQIANQVRTSRRMYMSAFVKEKGFTTK